MSDRPAIFSAPMVLALQREVKEPGTGKTQTRRLTSSPLAKAVGGDRLYVRETWKPHSVYAGMKPRNMPVSKVFYRADDSYAPSNTPWVPGIHMPRWASRLTLLLTEVRFECLQDISDADALAEGITAEEAIVGAACYGGHHHEITATRFFYDGCDEEGHETAVEAYAALWDQLHGAGSWDQNPELVALTFSVHGCNIDQMAQEAA